MSRWPAKWACKACKTSMVNFKMKPEKCELKQERRFSPSIERGERDEVWSAGITVCDVADSDSNGGILVDI